LAESRGRRPGLFEQRPFSLAQQRERPKLKMPREIESSLNEKQFVLQSLEEKIRLDGRDLETYRPLELDFGDEHGVVNVALGNTRQAHHGIRNLRLPPSNWM
jgi:hypothetical protein